MCCSQLCSHCGWLLLKCSTIGIGFNGAETNCRIAHILGILLMNSCNTDRFLATTVVYGLSTLNSFVNQVNKSLLLGTVVDNKLSWTAHLIDLKKRFAITLALLKRCKLLPKNVLEAFYFTVILPTVTYGLPLWGCCGNKELFN